MWWELKSFSASPIRSSSLSSESSIRQHRAIVAFARLHLLSSFWPRISVFARGRQLKTLGSIWFCIHLLSFLLASRGRRVLRRTIGASGHFSLSSLGQFSLLLVGSAQEFDSFDSPVEEESDASLLARRFREFEIVEPVSSFSFWRNHLGISVVLRTVLFVRSVFAIFYASVSVSSKMWLKYIYVFRTFRLRRNEKKVRYIRVNRGKRRNDVRRNGRSGAQTARHFQAIRNISKCILTHR